MSPHDPLSPPTGQTVLSRDGLTLVAGLNRAEAEELLDWLDRMAAPLFRLSHRWRDGFTVLYQLPPAPPPEVPAAE